jgi:CubicO group peptidase (beta-lactamase class C family)
MMERAKDRFRFILDRPIIAPPGTRWNYNGGCNPIIGRLIEKGSGETLSNFAREALFSHLGIDKFEWAQGADGAYSAASGLRLTPRDLARIGLLVLGNGAIDGTRIVSSGWIEGSGQAVIPTGDGLQYSRSWFLLDTPAPAFKTPQKTMSGFGNGGQRLFLMPAAGLVCVIFGGRYDEMDSRIYPTRMWREIVLGNFERL